MSFVNWYPSWEQRSVFFNIFAHFPVNKADDKYKGSLSMNSFSLAMIVPFVVPKEKGITCHCSWSLTLHVMSLGLALQCGRLTDFHVPAVSFPAASPRYWVLLAHLLVPQIFSVYWHCYEPYLITFCIHSSDAIVFQYLILIYHLNLPKSP